MQLKKLDNSFYAAHTHLKNALDNYDGKWDEGKIRGYGIVIIEIDNLKFAIPLRSNIKHKASLVTEKDYRPGIKGRGLDFSKALLITNDRYISKENFNISPEQKKRLKNDFFITQKFEKYVSHYIKAVYSNDHNILNKLEYRFTTLVHYHRELGITEPNSCPQMD